MILNMYIVFCKDFEYVHSVFVREVNSGLEIPTRRLQADQWTHGWKFPQRFRHGSEVPTQLN